MESPNLILDIQDAELREALSKRDSIKRFKLITKDQQGHSWIEAIKPSRIDVAIVQADDFSEEDLDKLVSNQIAYHTDVIFISHGLPNPAVDSATRQGACYHLRYPVDFDFLDQLLTESLEGFGQKYSNENVVITSDLNIFI